MIDRVGASSMEKGLLVDSEYCVSSQTRDPGWTGHQLDSMSPSLRSTPLPRVFPMQKTRRLLEVLSVD
jgi:hypothetical protein